MLTSDIMFIIYKNMHYANLTHEKNEAERCQSVCPRSCSSTSLHQVPTGVDSRALALSTIYTEKQVHIVF